MLTSPQNLPLLERWVNFAPKVFALHRRTSSYKSVVTYVLVHMQTCARIGTCDCDMTVACTVGAFGRHSRSLDLHPRHSHGCEFCEQLMHGLTKLAGLPFTLHEPGLVRVKRGSAHLSSKPRKSS